MLNTGHIKLQKPVLYKTVISSMVLSRAQNLFLYRLPFLVAANYEGGEKVIVLPILYVAQLK